MAQLDDAFGTGQIASLASGAAAHGQATRTYEPHADAHARYGAMHERMTRVVAALREIDSR